MIILPEGQQQHRLHPRSLPTSPVKSVSSRPVSMYSNWSFSSTATGASSFASSSSATSIGSSENCNCETDSRKGFDTRSFISSITSRTTATSATCTSLADASELRYGSIYRFSHRYLPESLVAYLNIEPKSEVQAFYGPILDCGVILETTTNAEIPTKSLIVTSIVTELLRALQELRKTVRKLAELDSRRNVRNKVDGQKGGTISSGRIVKMHFDLITGRAMTESQFVVNSTLIVTFQFYLIGQCCATEQHGSIGDEFYACFKLNSSLPGTGSKHQSHSSPSSTTSNRPSRWSIGRLSLKLDSEASKARKARASLMVASAVDRSSEYELNRLDYLRGDFEELMQAVRHNRPV